MKKKIFELLFTYLSYSQISYKMVNKKWSKFYIYVINIHTRCSRYSYAYFNSNATFIYFNINLKSPYLHIKFRKMSKMEQDGYL